VRIEHALELLEVAGRRDHITAGALDRLHVERRELALPGLGIMDAVVFALEQARELIHAVQATVLALLAIGAAEAVGIWHELGAVAEVAIAAAVAIGGGDGGGAQGAAVVAALEGEHQALAALGIAHQLE